MTDELWKLDALAQAALVRRGDVTPLELVDAAIARIEAVEPQVHALAYRDFDYARQRAQAPLSGPLAGVPFLVKDLSAYPGMRHAMGSRLFASNVATEPTLYTERLDAAGLIVLGKTTTSEFGLLGSTETLLEGATHNPWDLERTAGGSSGGSAAAVAARMVPMAHGSDGGGSIRTPASMNGVFGFKPGRGRVVPSTPDDMHGLLVDHGLSLRVADSAMLLSLTERVDGQEPPVGFVSEPSAQRLRIGWYTETLTGQQSSAAARDVLLRSVELCRDLGHNVCETPPPPIDGAALGDAFFTLAGAAMDTLCQMMVHALGRPPDERELEPFVLDLIEWYRRQPEDGVDRARAAIGTLGGAMRDYCEGFDVVMCPTQPMETWHLGTLAPDRDYAAIMTGMERLAGYTAIHNFAGIPAMSVPLFTGEGGVPLGTHFAAPIGAERTLLALAYELESACPWHQRVPVMRG